MRGLPESLRHQARGRPPAGPSRYSGGLVLEGFVVAVHVPDGRPDRQDRSESENVGVTLDIEVIEPGMRTILYDVPVMTESGGLNDHARWRPRAASADIAGGTTGVSVDPGTADEATPTTDRDGDRVVVGFLGNDLNRPFVMGQLPHPRTNRRPSTNDSEQYALDRWVRGIHFGVTEGGDVHIDLSAASDGSIDSGGAEQANATGNLTITLKADGVVTIDGGGTTEWALLAESFLPALKSGLQEVADLLTGLGLTHPNLDSLLANITTSTSGPGAPYLSQNLKHD